MDISDTLAPNSDQLDAVDLLGSPPRIFTVTKVTKGGGEQPVNVHLAEFPRVWRPGKTMRRVLAGCWGRQADEWVGRRVELFCDETVMYGGKAVGGVRISRLSHIDKPRSVPIIVRQGQGGTYKVDPLPAEKPTTPALTDAMIATATDKAQLGEWWRTYPERRADIEARVAELDAEPGGDQ